MRISITPSEEAERALRESGIELTAGRGFTDNSVTLSQCVNNRMRNLQRPQTIKQKIRIKLRRK